MVNACTIGDHDSYKHAKQIAKKFFSESSGSSSHTVHAMGHAHIDSGKNNISYEQCPQYIKPNWLYHFGLWKETNLGRVLVNTNRNLFLTSYSWPETRRPSCAKTRTFNQKIVFSLWLVQSSMFLKIYGVINILAKWNLLVSASNKLERYTGIRTIIPSCFNKYLTKLLLLFTIRNYNLEAKHNWSQTWLHVWSEQ